MQTILKRLLQLRGARLTLEIVLITFIFFAVKTYMQRDLVAGTVPDIDNNLLHGQPISLQSFRGKPVLVHFWATWCSVCKLEEDNIAAISKDYNVVTIAMKSGSGIEIEKYLQKNQLAFPVIVDQEGTIAARFGVQGVPTSFVIDPNGNIAFTVVGYTTRWGLRFRLWMVDG